MFIIFFLLPASRAVYFLLWSLMTQGINYLWRALIWISSNPFVYKLAHRTRNVGTREWGSY